MLKMHFKNEDISDENALETIRKLGCLFNKTMSTVPLSNEDTLVVMNPIHGPVRFSLDECR